MNDNILSKVTVDELVVGATGAFVGGMNDPKYAFLVLAGVAAVGLVRRSAVVNNTISAQLTAEVGPSAVAATSRVCRWYAIVCAPASSFCSGRISSHHFITRSDREKNRWPPMSMRFPL